MKVKDIRFEVIDEIAGRIVVRDHVDVETSIQDDGQTLKIFIGKHKE